MGMGWLFKKRYFGSEDDKLRRRRNRGIGIIAGGERASEKKWSGLGQEVARFLVHKDWTMVYCGMGSGLAGKIARDVLAGKGRVKAIVVEDCEPPDLPPDAVRAVVKNFHQRRSRLFRDPLAFLVLPGGPGTLGEFTELAVWHAAGVLEKPVVLLDPDNWFEPVVHFYEKAKRSKVSPWRTDKLFHRVPDIESAGRYLSKAIEEE